MLVPRGIIPYTHSDSLFLRLTRLGVALLSGERRSTAVGSSRRGLVGVTMGDGSSSDMMRYYSYELPPSEENGEGVPVVYRKPPRMMNRSLLNYTIITGDRKR